MKWLGVLMTLASSACTCLTADGLLFSCGEDGGCEGSLRCGRDLLCHPAEAARADAGPDGGEDGGADRDAGNPDAGAIDAGFDGGFDAGIDAGVCRVNGARCDQPSDCCETLCVGLTCQPRAGVCDAVAELSLGLTSFPLSGLNRAGLTSCGPAAGPERIFSLVTKAAATPLFVRLDSPDAGATVAGLALYLRSECAPAFSIRDLSCVDAPNLAHAAIATTLGPGTWFIFADSATGTSANESLFASTSISGEDCASAWPLVVVPPLASVVRLRADTSTLGHDVRPSCVSTFGAQPDGFVHVSVPRAGQLIAKVDSTWDAVVSIFSGPCPLGAELACSNNTTSGEETATLSNQAAGEFLIVISGASATSAGPFTLELTFR